ncbi:hypothetical protein LCE31_39835, partial [Streptomyces sp. 8L]|nr:hypothetical protein [Streptomyces sp. 8L]
TVTPATSDQLSRPLTDALTDAFIVKPAMLLQYGQLFSGKCATEYSTTKLSQLAYEREISDRTAWVKNIYGLTDYISPQGSVSGIYDSEVDMAVQWATDHFGQPPMQKFEKNCVKGDVTAAKKASLDKVGGAVFLLVAAVIVCVLITALAAQFQVAQCRIAWDSVRGEATLIAGTIPGPGRALLWEWASSVFRSLAEVLWSVIALAVFIVFVVALLNPTTAWGDELTIRFLVIDILCIGAIVKRKKIQTRSREIAGTIRTRMANSPYGGAHGSSFGAPSPQSARRPQAARTTARALVRTAMIGVALASGQPLTAAAYALPSQLGAATLMSLAEVLWSVIALAVFIVFVVALLNPT